MALMHNMFNVEPQLWGPPQCKYDDSVKHNDPDALINYNK